MSFKIKNNVSVMGSVTVPGDKSVSHRAIMIGAIAQGRTVIENFLFSDDCLATIDCFKKLGASIDTGSDGIVTVYGKGLKGLKPYEGTLYTGNSGTTCRLLSGILSGQEFSSRMQGDTAVNSRPMERVIKPLTMMGARISAREGGYCPLEFSPSKLTAIDFKLPVASAQLKSAILLAGLYAQGTTTVRESVVSRNHTELMLKHFGANLIDSGGVVTLCPTPLTGKRVYVPADISSAAFFIVAALISGTGSLVIKNVGVNPTRTGIVDIMRKMGGQIEYVNYKSGAEPYADLYVKASKLKGVKVGGDIIPRLIDEIPAIAVAAAFAQGKTEISGASELRVKECDRIKALHSQLSAMGADIREKPDGLIINGTGGLAGDAELNSFGDHRIAMAMAVAATFAKKPCTLIGGECVSVSFPGFFSVLEDVIV